jgi:hypothetical protein
MAEINGRAMLPKAVFSTISSLCLPFMVTNRHAFVPPLHGFPTNCHHIPVATRAAIPHVSFSCYFCPSLHETEEQGYIPPLALHAANGTGVCACNPHRTTLKTCVIELEE